MLPSSVHSNLKSAFLCLWNWSWENVEKSVFINSPATALHVFDHQAFSGKMREGFKHSYVKCTYRTSGWRSISPPSSKTWNKIAILIKKKQNLTIKTYVNHRNQLLNLAHLLSTVVIKCPYMKEMNLSSPVFLPATILYIILKPYWVKKNTRKCIMLSCFKI